MALLIGTCPANIGGSSTCSPGAPEPQSLGNIKEGSRLVFLPKQVSNRTAFDKKEGLPNDRFLTCVVFLKQLS